MTSSRRFDIRAAAVALLAMALATGCQYMINPFNDDVEGGQSITSPTLIAAEQHAGQPTALRERTWNVSTRYYPKGGVNHWPLWFQDPFEDMGSQDNKYVWTIEDYIAMPYGWARWDLNTFALPISMIVTPPGTIMSSDGDLSKQLLGYDHDARIGPTHSVEKPPKKADASLEVISVPQ